MNIQQIDLSKTLTDDQVYEAIMNNYSGLSKNWILHQWNWMNNVYWPFKDHYKYLIIISYPFSLFSNLVFYGYAKLYFYTKLTVTVY